MNIFTEALLNGQKLSCTVIDTHGHLGRYCFGIPGTDPSFIIQDMDRIGVQSVIVSSMNCTRGDWTAVTAGNDEVYEAMTGYPGRILGYFTVIPGEETAVRAETARRMSQGFTGIKLHTASGYKYNDPGFIPLFEEANRASLPILYHAWGGDEMNDIRTLAEKYSNCTHILAHGGAANPEKYIELCRAFPNIYMDTAVSSSPRGLIEQLVQGAGANKVLWGSDVHFYSQTQQIGKILGAALDDETKKMILGLNAEKILGRIKNHRIGY